MTKLTVTIDDQTFDIDVLLTPACSDQCLVKVNGEDLVVTIPRAEAQNPEIEWMIIDGHPYELTVDDNLNWIRAYSGIHAIAIEDREQNTPRPRSGDGRIKAPIPGLVTRILVSEGELVHAEQPLIVLEAMKMENEIRAPFDGLVRSIAVSVGDSVVRRAVLAEVI